MTTAITHLRTHLGGYPSTVSVCRLYSNRRYPLHRSLELVAANIITGAAIVAGSLFALFVAMSLVGMGPSAKK